MDGQPFRKSQPVSWGCAHRGAANRHEPLASPLYAQLAGLPPVQLFVANNEQLLDDSIRLADALDSPRVEWRCNSYARYKR
ncbi:alpha/beta hydrolase fold domain-containing protein [Aquisalimonas sp.]|uniref:alpha/beta hydrolase fold domain-containing protein n=1 Tax=Aquisalimonas sp. TaxID=1872621 RepID=UPI0034553E7F